ncbi:uncharacterized protein LOC131246147 [Magnolia sinica]|uniref:uncharacterized protein LOC131246147 n=1 Tax=Magnolia sinica TaxID=86752 RepID=UPI002659C81F|nr:uncharacterized protein LOC131246147 [Magnolia sinica]XP_058102034.1 uncharacterized protein LOC131246147 [Magnolia sinica]XP_058102035.1 uncharacterized protein LOC131246147 [Magnolia sinica]
MEKMSDEEYHYHSLKPRKKKDLQAAEEEDKYYSFNKNDKQDKGGGEGEGTGADRYYSFKKKKKKQQQQQRNEDKEEKEEEEEGSLSSGPLSSNSHVRLAIYIAMAHAGLALSLILLYGLIKLLEEYWRPIQWAILCSMPLRELQTTLVRFWSHPLQLGLFETILAVPLAIIRAAIGSVIDSQAALLRLIRRRRRNFPARSKITFPKLMQWLVSFGLFVFSYERIGSASYPIFAIPGFIAYAAGYAPGVPSTITAMSSVHRGVVPGPRSPPSRRSVLSWLSCYMTSGILKRLNTVVGIGLITLMIVGSVMGLVFFSYKIGLEGRDAVISLKTHLQENNYTERIGLNRWMDENHIPELIDTYTTKFYETMSQSIDSLALQYNVTEIVDGFRNYLVGPLLPPSSFTSNVWSGTPDGQQILQHHPFSEKLHHLWLQLQGREWNVIYSEIAGTFRVFLSVIMREDLVEKMKGFALQSVDVSKRVFASSSMVLAGSANILVSVAVSIISGAAGLLNFISQLMVFFWLLYYLITSESGGVMDHVLGMLPVSKSTRIRCADVLDHAVSSVLLATAKVTLFQGCLTYLLFRFYHIHFLYTSTFLALMSAVLPITPTWLSSIPAVAQLAIESRYIEAVLLPAIHLILLDYGTAAIQDDVPGQSAYLTGLSILGGIALFPSALEGAIMGPLLLTVMIAMKNLYAEFVLPSAKEAAR